MDETSYCKRENATIDFSLEEVKQIVKKFNMYIGDISEIFLIIKLHRKQLTWFKKGDYINGKK